MPHKFLHMNQNQKARLAALSGNFLFGTSVIAVKHLSPHLVPSIALTAIRITVTMLLFWGMFAIKPGRTGIVKKDFVLLFFCALAGITMNQTFSISGMSLTSPIHASLLVLTTPIAITLLAAWFLKERLTILKLTGLLLGISGGVLLVFSRDLSAVAGKQQSLGDLFIIIGALSYSVYVISIKPLMAKYKAKHILQWVFLFGTCVSLPIGWSDLAAIQWMSFDFIDWFALVYVVLGATFFAYRLMNYSISILGAAITGTFIYTQPFFTTIAAMLLLHESLSLQKLGAAALIMGGVFLSTYRKK